MRIAVDAMGGDYAPSEVVKGALWASEELGDEVILVGIKDKVKEILDNLEGDKKFIDVVDARDIVDMNEKPTQALKKADSSISKGLTMLKNNDVQAFVSAGNTGAVSAAALMKIGRIKGVLRPALGVLMPTLKGRTLLIDVGANVDCKPEYLVQFAIMGTVYMETILHKEKPSVGLLTIGSEERKGNKLVLDTYPMLKAAPVNFIGNIEGGDVPAGAADIVVCDGFVGNIVLKFVEGVAEGLYKLVQEEISYRFWPRIGMVFMLPMLKDLWKDFNYEEYGGVPLLGINGVVVIAHGKSKALAISNAVKVAKHFYEQGGVEKIGERLAEGDDN